MVRVRKTCWLFTLCAAAVLALSAARAAAYDVSAPAILQMYEARWTTIEDRMADIFEVGYGQMWLPPPQRAGGGFSVGYDVFDRFDLGAPRNETLYGTETSLKAQIAAAHNAGLSIYTDFIPNHNGFGNRFDSNFVALGGYPGFALTLPSAPHNDINGDFHDPNAGGDLEGRLAGLVDIAQEKNHQFIRHPIAAGPNNIPAGAVYNKPNPNNARLYTDRDLDGLILNDPALGGNFTRYNFNAAAPLAGDPVLENGTGLLMRNAQWMVEVIGVDGFRIDAAKHFPRWVLDHLDQAVFRANPRLQHDGSIKPAFMFSEVYDGSKGFQQQFIEKTLPDPHAIDPSNTTVGGNRDVLDFPLFFALRDNLTDNGLGNNWHNIRGASMDTNDRGPGESEVWDSNGSQGVAFAQSHDDFGPHLTNVAYAYTLLRPGNATVYMNAKQFGDNRDFPKDGRGDALGGIHGDTIATLVDIRNSHGRGDFRERWIDEAFGDTNGDGQKSNIYIYERENSAIVGLNNRLDSGYDQRSPVQTAFEAGAVLVELTGNAADGVVDPGGDIPEAIRINGSGQATIRIPRNASHGRGYVVYGLAAPQGDLSLSNVSQVLAGATPTLTNNGTARLADIDVITADTFSVRLDTTPVMLPAPMGETSPVRDFDADGDQALVKIDGGMNLNNLPGVDVSSPSDVSYGFEQFTDTRLSGYVSDGMGGNTGTGAGVYEQSIDTTQLAEGRHYVTVRAYRHRDGATGGDGGPPVFSDFKRTIYVDRLPPESEITSFEPFASNPGNPNNRDLIVRSVDQTANNVHVLLDLPANLTESQILALVQGGNKAGYYDRDQFARGVFGVTTGNHVATVVTFEPTGNHNVQRFTGLLTETNLGLGFGDMNASGLLTVSDIRCSGVCSNFSVEDVLYSQNNKFRAAFDVNGDGLGDNRDLFALGDELIAGGAGQAVLDSYVDLLLHRGDFNDSGMTDSDDVALLYDSFGSSSWLMDLNVDGVVNIEDVSTMIGEVFRTMPGDFNLDGAVDAADYVAWRRGVGASSGALYSQADADLDGDVDEIDLAQWRSQFGFMRQPLVAGSGSQSALGAIPEPARLALGILAIGLLPTSRRRPRDVPHWRH